MATAIASLPNEVPENNVVMKVEEKNMKVPNPPKQEPIPSAPTELSQESIHQIVQGLHKQEVQQSYQIEKFQLVIVILFRMNKLNLILFRSGKYKLYRRGKIYGRFN